jgi:hypothetical protein
MKSKFPLSQSEPKTFKDNLKLRQSRHIRLFHNINNIVFIIVYNH